MDFLNSIKSNNLRSKLLNKNIIISIGLQGVTMIISLILLPLSLDFVSVEQYGVWLTINTILMWSSNFDLGLGAGLKNNLGRALANNNDQKARELISTAYFVMFLIMGGMSLLYFLISEHINWVDLFNLNTEFSLLIQKTINIVVYFFLLRFILQLINVVMDAMQKLYMAKINIASSQLIILIVILVLSQSTTGDMFMLGLIFSTSPLIIFLISSFWFFTKHKNLAPSFKSINFDLVKCLYNVGLKFFFVQLSMIFLFQSTNIIIIRFFGPEDVVKYNVAYNLFSMISLAFTTISAPYWSAYISAWAKNDIEWIKKTNKNLIKIWLAIVCVSAIVLLFSDKIYYIWLGRDLNIPFELSLAIYLYMCVFSFGGIYNMFINSTGKLKIQIISLGISTTLYFPILWFFISILDWGLISFPLALLVISNYSLILAPIQFNKLIKGNARGRWNS